MTADFTGDANNSNPTPNPTPCTGTGAEIVHISPVGPAQATTQSADGALGSTTITDSDSVTGAFGAAGANDKVTFRLYGPFATAAAVCTGTPVKTVGPTALTGGTASTTNQTWTADTTASPYTPTQAGFYAWQVTADFTGDANNSNPTPNPTPCTGTGSEIVHISPVGPAQATTQSADGALGSTTITDSDSVTGAFGVGRVLNDKVTFRLYGPFPTATAAACTGTPRADGCQRAGDGAAQRAPQPDLDCDTTANPYTPTQPRGCYAGQVNGATSRVMAITAPDRRNPTPCTGTGSEIVHITPVRPNQATHAVG